MHLGTRALTLTVDGLPRTADVSDCRIVSEAVPDDERDLCGPARRYRLQCTAAQDLSADSLWSLVWGRDGDRVDVELRPDGGGQEPTPDRPWFAGRVTIAEPDGDLLGGAANASPGARFTFEIDWIFDAKPERLDSLTDLLDSSW